jgi:asparagine synthase (glutamine-hydrolysing)
MCGIAGQFAYASSARVDESILARMRDTMIHRGPDGAGSWISSDGRVGLAHRRLSIIDLSTAAAQPMANEDGAVIVTFNGEIYNYRGLRAELAAAGHRYRTDHSDTEVLLHGYEQWGLGGLLERIEGDYAFALWDDRAGQLHLARDRIGVKPLYFALQDGMLLFGSEIKAIAAHPAVTPDVEPVAMYHYLSFITTPAPLTMFKGIYKLPAGWHMTVRRDGGVSARRYWDAVPGKGIERGALQGMSAEQREGFYVQGIRDRLTAAVEKRMMSDVPFGVFLSGGVDSSTNVALMSRYTDQPLNTFSVGFKDYTHLNELDYAERVAKQFRTRHREILIEERDMVGYLDQLIHHQDEPIADWVCIPLYFVSKLAHDSGITVVQVGEGSDEQFSGYGTYMSYLRLHRRAWEPFERHVPDLLRPAIAGAARAVGRRVRRLAVHADFADRAARGRELFWSGAMSFWDLVKEQALPAARVPSPEVPAALVDCGMLPKEYLEADTYGVVQSMYSALDRAHPGLDPLTRMIHSEFRIRLPELLLMRVDKISMSVSLEGRVPFLDHALVDFTMDIPMADKVRGGEPKRLLKRAVEGWIPDDIIYRKKMGFGAPMSQWLRGEFGARVEREVLASPLMRRGWFETDFIRQLCAEHRSGRRDNSLHLWTLFNLTAWYDYWVAGTHRA